MEKTDSNKHSGTLRFKLIMAVKSFMVKALSELVFEVDSFVSSTRSFIKRTINGIFLPVYNLVVARNS